MSLDKRLTIKTDKDFKILQKRLLCQPISFKGYEVQEGWKIEYSSSEEDSLVKHLSDTVSEFLHEEVITSISTDKGLKKDWVKQQLIARLKGDESHAPWLRTIKQETEKIIRKEKEYIDLEVFYSFGLHEAREQLTIFAEALEDVVFTSVIERMVNSMKELEPGAQVPEEEIIDLILNDGHFELANKHISLVDSRDFEEGFMNIFASQVYEPGCSRLNEAQMISYVLSTMHRWAMKKINVPESLQKTIEYHRKRLDIPVEVIVQEEKAV